MTDRTRRLSLDAFECRAVPSRAGLPAPEPDQVAAFAPPPDTGTFGEPASGNPGSPHQGPDAAREFARVRGGKSGSASDGPSFSWISAGDRFELPAPRDGWAVDVRGETSGATPTEPFAAVGLPPAPPPLPVALALGRTEPAVLTGETGATVPLVVSSGAISVPPKLEALASAVREAVARGERPVGGPVRLPLAVPVDGSAAEPARAAPAAAPPPPNSQVGTVTPAPTAGPGPVAAAPGGAPPAAAPMTLPERTPDAPVEGAGAPPDAAPAAPVPTPVIAVPATSAEFADPGDSFEPLVLLGVPLAGAWAADVAGVGEWARQVLAAAGAAAEPQAADPESLGWLAGAAVLTAGVGYGLVTRPRRKWVPAGPGPGSVLALWTDCHDPHAG